MQRFGVIPILFYHRVEPDGALVLIQQPLQPDLAGLWIVVFDAAIGIDDFVRAHGCIADKNQLVVGAVGIEYVVGRHALVMAAFVVFHTDS